MKTLKQFLLSRKVVITLILLILAFVVAGYIFPQKFTSTQEQLDKWRDAYPFWAKWGVKIGLDHVYTTPWFAATLLIFLFTLVLSTIEQINISYRKSFGPSTAPDAEGCRISAVREDIIAAIKKERYCLVYHDESNLKFVRYRWGYWGNVLLHLGLIVSIASSLLIVLTEKRGLLHLVEGESYSPGSQWVIEDIGILGGSFILPEAVRLERSNIEFYETDEVKRQTTEFSFMDTAGKETRHTVGINLNVDDKGLRVYQGRNYGEAFYISIVDADGKEFNTIFLMEHPLKRDKASYGRFMLEGIPYLIKTKYFADAEKKVITGENPLLVMRLVQIDQSLGGVTGSGEGGRLKLDIVEKEKVHAEVSLRSGEKKPFGDYTAELVHVAKWTGLIFVRSIGMTGIFTGFLIIIIGGTLTYFMPPREIHARKEEEGFLLTWKASRFKSLYEEEFERIRKRIEDVSK